MGHIAVACDLGQGGQHRLVGFENHSGRTYLGPGIDPLGRVIAGSGNNGEDGTEGARYREVYATYLHGPVLPKNPWLTDHLISMALLHRYRDAGTLDSLAPLEDQTEDEAHAAALRLACPPDPAGGGRRWRPVPGCGGWDCITWGQPTGLLDDTQASGQGDGMDFSLSTEQRELKEAAIAFARQELDQDLAKREDVGEFSAQAWRACAQFGIQGLPVPAELGGGGADILTTVLVMEALGYGCHDNGLIFSLNAQMWSLELPLVKFGTPAQQQAYLPGLMSGDLVGVHAMTEPDSGSDAFSMRTRPSARGMTTFSTGPSCTSPTPRSPMWCWSSPRIPAGPGWPASPLSSSTRERPGLP